MCLAKQVKVVGIGIVFVLRKSHILWCGNAVLFVFFFNKIRDLKEIDWVCAKYFWLSHNNSILFSDIKTERYFIYQHINIL